MLRIANEVLPGLVGREGALGRSSSGGACFGLPSAVLRSQSITRTRLTGQGGGRFSFYPLIFRGRRAGANVLRTGGHSIAVRAAGDAVSVALQRCAHRAGNPLAPKLGVDIVADFEWLGLERLYHAGQQHEGDQNHAFRHQNPFQIRDRGQTPRRSQYFYPPGRNTRWNVSRPARSVCDGGPCGARLSACRRLLAGVLRDCARRRAEARRQAESLTPRARQRSTFMPWTPMWSVGR